VSKVRHIFSLFLFATPFILLYGCKGKPTNQAANFGDLDSSKIAADTTMQANMDLSYEYQKTLKESDSVVFDFLAYDRPQPGNDKVWESKFLLIRRTKTAQDTVIKGSRSDVVKNIWISDLDKNGKPEIMFYEYPRASKKRIQLYVFEIESPTTFRSIESNFKEYGLNYRGGDTIFAFDKYLIRKFPTYKKAEDKTPSGAIWESYKLEKGKLVLFKTKEV
jgi:hypothetical protein